MSAEQASFGLFAWKRKRDDEFATACAAMQSAISNSAINALQSSNISRGSDDETVQLLNNDSQTQTPSPLTNLVATKIVDEVTKLQKENPMNTKFLTEVLQVTTEYIRNPNPENLRKYQTMQEQVATKYGRYSALSGALFGLPAAVFVGGVIGLTSLCLALPPLAVPIAATVGIVVLVIAMAASLTPANISSDIARSWNKLEGNMTTSKPSLGR